MTGPLTVNELLPEEAELLRTVAPLRRMMRAAFAGVPFRLEARVGESARAMPAYPEAMILSMVERGLLWVTQCAAEWPGRAPARPFTVILSPHGADLRRRLLDRGNAVVAASQHRLAA